MAELKDLKDYVGVLTEFGKNPVGYVLGILVGAVLSIVEGGMLQLVIIYQIVTEQVLGNAGRAVLESFVHVGDVPLTILGALNDLLVTGAQAGGVFAPLIYVFAWTVLVVVVVEALRFAWRTLVVVT